MIAWIQAQKTTRSKSARVIVNLIDTSTGEVVWADEVRGANRDSVKKMADRLAVAVKQQLKSKT
ncbi:MAG: hypothetical protein K1X67_14610 [Fimbriimonadaceae bacterium]|nr:hypothetical protein [Fimbriimonadaceae bacterium]